MPLGLIGRKLGMTQIFDQEGHAVPVTVIQAGPCRVVQLKSRQREGYEALQLGFEPVKWSRVNKPLAGHFRRAGTEPFRFLREFRVETTEGFEVGQTLTVEIFQAGERVDVTGVSKGRGFAGVMRRWGFRGGPASHGSMFHRRPGSIGSNTDPGRVPKGRRMAGHYGNQRVTVKNLQVVEVRPDANLLLVKGAVPGSRNSLVLIKKRN